jgi:hypothetical protein
VLSDEALLNDILERFEKFGCGDDYWTRIYTAIEVEVELKYNGDSGNA